MIRDISLGAAFFLFVVTLMAAAEGRPEHPVELKDESRCDLPVERVSDGDSFRAYTITVISPSLRRVELTGFRLLDVRAPERKEPRYEEAKADLVELIDKKLVRVEPPEKGRLRDRWGRILVTVYTCREPVLNVNEEMRRRGWVNYGR